MAEPFATVPLSPRRTIVLAAGLGALAGLAVWMRLGAGGGGSPEEYGTLYVARLLGEQVPWSTYSYAPGSHIPLHLFGFGDRFEGLIGARLVSAVLALGSLGFFFGGMRSLFGSSRVAGWAVLLLALQAPHLLLGKLVTADVVAFFFFTGSMWLLIEGLSTHYFGWLLAMLASVGFAIAVLCKYVVLVHAPVLIVVVAVRRPRLLFAALLPCSLLIADYLYSHWADLRVLATNQLARVAGLHGSRLGILHTAAVYAAPMLGLALASLTMQLSKAGAEWRAIRLHLVLLLLATPMVALHVLLADDAALVPHLVYPLVALVPLAAWFLHRLSQRQLAIPLALAAVLAGVGLEQVSQLTRATPDVRPALAYLEARVGPITTVLSEDAFAVRYTFDDPARGEVRAFQELTWLDNDRDGKRTPQDAIDAIWDGKPDYVLLTGQVAPALVEKLREGVLPRRYRKAFEQPYELSGALSKHTRGAVQVWRRVGPSPLAPAAPRRAAN